ncbi:MAG: hypothetical protein HYY41_05945 [Chloroflexi bacterium]|nr:hypothetical protein [Chloroflexota bacterium]
MKYRVRLDLSFDNEADAQALMVYAKDQSVKAVSINEGMPNEEIAFCDLEICRHDDPSSGKGCEKMERVEIRKLPA